MNSQIRTKKNSLRFATVIVLTASFAVLQLLSLFALNLQNVLTMWGQQLQVNVYLSDQTTPEQTTQVQNFLKNSDRIDHVEYISSKKALSNFKDQMASYAPDLLKDDDLLKVIPASLQFSLSDKVAAQDQVSTMKSLAEQLKTQAGVEEVSYGQDWVKAYSSLVMGIKSAVGFLIFAIGGAALFVISNVIRQSIHQRRDAIEVLELVGATTSFIRKPFLKEGALLALISGGIALGSSAMIFSWLQKSLSQQLQFFQLASSIHFFSAAQSLLIVGLSMILGLFASYLCLRSLNDGWAASQRVNDRG